MKQIIVFALVAACLVAATTKPAATHFVDTKTVLAEIDKDPFGNTILSAIQLSVATKSPIDEVVVVVQQILSNVVQQQAQADEKNRTDQALCDETIGGFKKQIADLTDEIASLERSINDNVDIVTNAKTDLAQTERDYDETLTAIQQGTDQRNAEHSKWTEQDYQSSIEIATLEEGVKLIQHMIHGVAFTQIKARYDKVLEKLQEQSSAKKATLFKPLIAQLTQLANKLNYENVMKIMDLLNSIRAGIVEEQAQARLFEEKAQSDWEELLKKLEDQKQSLSDKKLRLQNLISSTEDLLKMLRESLENDKNELENVQASLAGQVAWCDNESNIYMTETAERTRESDILQKLLAHLQEKFQAVGDYVASRG